MSLENLDYNSKEGGPIKEEYFKLKERLEMEDQDLQKLKEIVKDISSQQLQENSALPLNPETGRLSEKEYAVQGIYPQEKVEGTEETVKELQKKWLQKLQLPKLEEQIKEEIIGEKIELLAFISSYKFLKDDFIICRSALYDDIDNGVDLLVFNKETGELVCTVDAGSYVKGKRAEEKKLKVLEKNKKGGAYLTYGLRLKYENEKKEITGGSAKNIPVFDLLIPYEEIKENIKEIESDFSKSSELEKVVFIHSMQIIRDQIEKMENPVLNIPPLVRERAKDFKKEIRALYPNIFSKSSGNLDFYLQRSAPKNKISK